MAKTPKTAEAPLVPATFEAETLYDVTLFRSVDFAGRKLLPSRTHTVKGKVAEQIRDAIHAASESEA